MSRFDPSEYPVDSRTETIQRESSLYLLYQNQGVGGFRRKSCNATCLISTCHDICM